MNKNHLIVIFNILKYHFIALWFFITANTYHHNSNNNAYGSYSGIWWKETKYNNASSCTYKKSIIDFSFFIFPKTLSLSIVFTIFGSITINLFNTINRNLTLCIYREYSWNHFAKRDLLKIMNLYSSPFFILTVAIGKTIHFQEISFISCIGKTKFLYFLSTVSLFVL